MLTRKFNQLHSSGVGDCLAISNMILPGLDEFAQGIEGKTSSAVALQMFKNEMYRENGASR